MLRGTLRTKRCFTIHPKVALGGSLDNVVVDEEVRKGRAAIIDYKKGNRVSDSDLVEWAWRLSKKGDEGSLNDIAEAFKSKGRNALGPGVLPTQKMLAHIAMGRHDKALDVLKSQFDGENEPLLSETYCSLLYILGITNSPASDWDAVLSTFSEHAKTDGALLSSTFFTSLIDNVYLTSPLLSWIVYIWCLSCSVRPSPEIYEKMLLSLYRQPHYTPVLQVLTCIPDLPKNVFHLDGVFENVDHILSKPSEHWQAESAKGGFWPGGDELAMNRSPGLPDIVQILTDKERELIKIFKLAMAQTTDQPFEYEARSACVNCRAVTTPGWAMRVLTEAHREKYLGPKQQSHIDLYAKLLGKLTSWSRWEDCCSLWVQAHHFIKQWRDIYKDDSLAHTTATFLPVLQAAGELGLKGFASEVIKEVYYSDLPMSVELLNGMINAAPADEGVKLFEQLAGKPNTHPSTETFKSLLKSGLRDYVPSDDKVSKTKKEREPTEADFLRSFAEHAVTFAEFFPEHDVCLDTLQKSVYKKVFNKDGHTHERKQTEGPTAKSRDTFPTVLKFLKERYSHVPYDNGLHSLLVASFLRRGDISSAEQACKTMITQHFRPSFENVAFWRAQLSIYDEPFPEFRERVNKLLSDDGSPLVF
eukprot:TRINITY_DN19741_c0_g1_i1.p1 TRINITY_DN19741_c0_g1~~TRINITY_DN19741_c0_g1_i1.p1  ORF type:complete len:643 (+),score=88.05 TRINITY_DN19741_c0_g1_i1:45-1973(+)